MKFTKCITKGLLAVAAVAMVAGQSTITSDAAYKYTVTVSGGNIGTINGQEKVVFDNQDPASDKIDFGSLDVQVKDEAYFVRGIRLAGQDNSAALALSGKVDVDGDTDYVIAYGVKKDLVHYTVNYVDASGNQLAESDTFLGNVGEKPVVGFKYVEGYRPQAYNLTKTLLANEAENVLTFTYEPGEVNVITTVVTTTVDGGTVTVLAPVAGATPGTGAAAGTAGGAAGAAGGAGAGAAAGQAGGAGAAGGADAGQAANGGNVEVTPQETPQDLVDLDDEDTPLADIDADNKANEKSSLPIVLGAAVAIAAVVALIGGLIYYKKRREL